MKTKNILATHSEKPYQSTKVASQQPKRHSIFQNDSLHALTSTNHLHQNLLFSLQQPGQKLLNTFVPIAPIVYSNNFHPSNFTTNLTSVDINKTSALPMQEGVNAKNVSHQSDTDAQYFQEDYSHFVGQPINQIDDSNFFYQTPRNESIDNSLLDPWASDSLSNDLNQQAVYKTNIFQEQKYINILAISGENKLSKEIKSNLYKQIKEEAKTMTTNGAWDREKARAHFKTHQIPGYTISRWLNEVEKELCGEIKCNRYQRLKEEAKTMTTNGAWDREKARAHFKTHQIPERTIIKWLNDVEKEVCGETKLNKLNNLHIILFDEKKENRYQRLKEEAKTMTTNGAWDKEKARTHFETNKIPERTIIRYLNEIEKNYSMKQ